MDKAHTKSSRTVDKLHNIKFSCKAHNSDIGGLCDDMSCQSKNQMMCVKCVADNNSCIRQKKHNFISIPDFVENFFDKEYDGLKKHFNYSKSVNTVENYLNNANEIFKNFEEKKEKLGQKFIEIYKDFLEYVNSLFVEFNNTYIQFITEKENLLKASFDNLSLLTSYDMLEGFKKEEFKEKMIKMPQESVNSTLFLMKRTIDGLKRNKQVKDEEMITSILSFNEDPLIAYYEAEFNGLKEEGLKRFNLYKNKLVSQHFSEGAVEEEKKAEELKTIYDSMIDYSMNSNFLDKKFTVFEHSNGNTILAYPTSQNTIKLEYFDRFLSPEQEMITSNPVLHTNFSLNARDPYLYFKLSSHAAKINDIIYYRYLNSDFLLSSSDDKTIKVWNITNLNTFLTNVNDYYKADCVKTLIGHGGRIISMQIFYDPMSSINYIVSVGYMDRIKLWDLQTGQFLKDFTDTTTKGSTGADSMVLCINKDKTSYMISASSFSNVVKIWDFNTGDILQVATYPYHMKIIKLIPYLDNQNVLIIDDKGPSVCMKLNNISDATLTPMNLQSFRTERINVVFWDQHILFILCKDGIVYQYDLNETKFTSSLRLGSSVPSYFMAYDHHTKKRLLITHSCDQHLKIWS